MEWISVEDRLPEPFVSVLVYMPGEEPLSTVHEGFIKKDGFIPRVTIPEIKS